MGEKHSVRIYFRENSIWLKTISILSSDFQWEDMIYTDLSVNQTTVYLTVSKKSTASVIKKRNKSTISAYFMTLLLCMQK